MVGRDHSGHWPVQYIENTCLKVVSSWPVLVGFPKPFGSCNESFPRERKARKSVFDDIFDPFCTAHAAPGLLLIRIVETPGGYSPSIAGMFC